jgi:aryl-alcohol dehydrogenase-like predicted oxidoreductase
MAQLSLNWLMHQQAVTSPIVGAKRPSQLEDTVGAVGWSVSDDDIEKIRKISDPVNQTLGDDQHMWH